MSLMSGPSTCLEPSLKVPVAVKDCFWPIEIEEAVGVTAIVCKLGVAAITTSLTTAAHTSVANLARSKFGNGRLTARPKAANNTEQIAYAFIEASCHGA